MRVLIAAVGRLKDGAEKVLADRYVERLAPRVGGIGPVLVVEIPEARQSSAAARQADEAERLMRAAAKADFCIALDERGKDLSSDSFAKLLGRKRDDGIATLAFLIGGPDGHGKAALDDADLMISLSPMTLPHGLARVVLAEQIYRAVTILSGHPYHRA
ncbi:MAG: 23S rRNA (pseudouridine(1915)-N(3))-methyltransferase RlmH [Hyphomicrobiaceae bacterium]